MRRPHEMRWTQQHSETKTSDWSIHRYVERNKITGRAHAWLRRWKTQRKWVIYKDCLNGEAWWSWTQSLQCQYLNKRITGKLTLKLKTKQGNLPRQFDISSVIVKGKEKQASWREADERIEKTERREGGGWKEKEEGRGMKRRRGGEEGREPTNIDELAKQANISKWWEKNYIVQWEKKKGNQTADEKQKRGKENPEEETKEEEESCEHRGGRKGR